MTCYRVFVGKDTLLDLVRSVKVVQVTDGMSNTLMVVEAQDSVPWTKPDDLPFDPAKHGQGNGLLVQAQRIQAVSTPRLPTEPSASSSRRSRWTSCGP